jgi:hypothetical protein
MTVLAQLSDITTSAAAVGVTVTVNVEGRLVALSLTPQALEAGPKALAALIFRLTEEASAAALNEGVAVLAPFVPEELTAELRALPLPTGESEEDYSTVETWAVPN